MNTLIISSSLSPDSRSFLLCEQVERRLNKIGVNVELVDARALNLNLYYKGMTMDMEDLSKKVSEADNVIIGMGVHCYSINDGLKLILDSCFGGAIGKFFGILCAAGGDKSYLSTMHLTQICMNEWRMIQLPRIVYALGSDFDINDNCGQDISDRLDVFTNEFYTIGKKLLA